MTTHTLNIGYTTGQTLTAKRFAVGSETSIETSTDCDECVNRKGRYDLVFEDAEAGDYLIVYFVSGTAAGSEYVTFTGDDAEVLTPWSERRNTVLDSAAQDEVLQAVSDANKRLDAIAAKTNLINAGRLRVLSRVCGNVITAHAGDDHLLSADNALTLEIDDDDASLYAQLTDTTNQAVTFGAGRANATDADDIVATIPAENFRHDGTSTLIDIELLSADTIGRRGEYEFDIQITNAAGYKITPQPLQGTLIIEMDRKS